MEDEAMTSQPGNAPGDGRVTGLHHAPHLTQAGSLACPIRDMLQEVATLKPVGGGEGAG